jgi:N-sulfoglucosamine sulfohydrolase
MADTPDLGSGAARLGGSSPLVRTIFFLGLFTFLFMRSRSLKLASVVWVCLLGSSLWAGSPNFLIILADDCTYNDLPVYGGENAHTPNIDRLATEGLTFNRAYVSMSICQPCRSELYTGEYPLRNGCAWNHAASRPETRSLPHHLTALGYRVGIAGKTDVFPKNCFPFEQVPGFDGNCVDRPTKPHRLEDVREFMTRKSEQPFCLVIGLVEPHVPWVMGDPSKYPPNKIKLPPNIADTKRTREDFGKYLAEITYMDGQVGEILGELARAGLETNTMVLFTSEQGSQFPGNKWTCWDTGLHTGLIAKWPGHVASGRRTDALVGYVDVVPTLLELAGGDPTKMGVTLDGTSFAPVLVGKKKTHRQFAYAIHDNLPEGPAYPSRTVSDGEWRYIRNLTPGELYIQKYLMGIQGTGELNNVYWGTWLFNSAERPGNYRLIKRYMTRPAEELYHTTADHFEMQNLAGDAKFAEIKTRLSNELDRWMRSQGDPGAAMDTTESLQAARDGKHRFVPPQ